MLQRGLLSVVACAALALAPGASGQAGALSPAGLSATDWSGIQQAYLKASNAGAFDYFGWAVAVSGNTVVVGAREENSAAIGVNGDQNNEGAPTSGAVYVFVRNGASWSQQAYLKASNTGANDAFGDAVAVSGDTLVVGADWEDSPATGVNGDQGDDTRHATDSGAAYVFVRNGTTWSQQAYLKASNSGGLDHFGIAVAISGDTLVVGSRSEDSAATGVNGDESSEAAAETGAAYVFVRSGTIWSQQAYFKASNADVNDWFGEAVAISGDTAVVGSRMERSAATGVNGDQSSNALLGAGAAYVFVRSGTTWVQQAYLKASNTGLGDWFGLSVAVSGDALVIGADAEDSDATGVNGDQGDDSAQNSGAAYVFTRSGTSWSQQAYLKASNTEQSDAFGFSVSVSGDAVVIGAHQEASRATGVNGAQNDNSYPWAGAAYLFVRSSASWSQQAYVKASNTGAYDNFGFSAAIAGDTLVIGAPNEASASTGVNGDQSINGAFASGAAYILDLDLDAWTDLGLGLAGTSGLPLLVGSGPLSAHSSNQLDLSNANPSSAATLVIGLSALDAPFKGGTLVPLPMRLVPLGTNGAGAATLPFMWPAGVPAATALYFQFWVSDPSAPAGLSASNGLKGVSG